MATIPVMVLAMARAVVRAVVLVMVPAMVPVMVRSVVSTVVRALSLSASHRVLLCNCQRQHNSTKLLTPT